MVTTRVLFFSVFLANCLLSQTPLNYRAVFGQGYITASGLDAAGNLYVAGATDSRNLPVTPGAHQSTSVESTCGFIPRPGGFFPPGPGIPILCRHGFVAKIDPTGSRLLYLTYLGGTRDDGISALAVDSAGSVTITGRTGSSDFPVTPGAYRSEGVGFVTKLSPDGSRAVFSTRLPAPGGVLAIDASGHSFIAGSTSDADFPTTPGAFQTRRYSENADAFLLKLSPDGVAVRFATLLGGTFADHAAAIAVNELGQVYLAGFTASTPSFARLGGAGYTLFPTTPGAFSYPGTGADSFLVKFNAEGSSLLYSSVFGGSGDDQMSALALDANGDAVFAAHTFYAPDFPLTPNAFQTSYGGAILGRLSADGSLLLYGTYLGASRSDTIAAIALSPAGNIHFRGVLTDPVATDPCFEPAPGNGFGPQVIGVFEPNSSTRLKKYLGNTAVAVDKGGHFYSRSDSRLFDPVDIRDLPRVEVRCILNAASLRRGPLVPGGLITLFGDGMPTEASGGKVLVNGQPAPLLYSSSTQINAVVPFGLVGGRPAIVEVRTAAGSLPPTTMEVAATSPAVFVQGGDRAGYAAALNEDGTLNTPQNAATQGSVVSVWFTGLGRMSPTQEDGAVGAGAVSSPVFRPKVWVSGVAADVLYCGNAPGLIAGIIQMNLRIPPVETGGPLNFQIELGDGATRSSQNVRLAIR